MKKLILSLTSLTGCTLLLNAQDPPRCGDGIRDPGELCYAIQEISLLGAAEYSAAADFDGDGFVDVATGERSGIVEIFLNDGTGTLARSALITTGDGEFINHIIAADFNGDGAIDLATSHFQRFSILLNDGSGTFIEDSVNPGCLDAGVSVCDGTNWIEAGDLDVDGDLDIVIANEANDVNNLGLGVAVWSNDGNGVFTHVTNVSFGDTERSVYIRDLDQNQRPEILVALADGLVVIAENTGAPGGFLFDTPVILNVPFTGMQTLAIADFDANGQQDIFSANSGGSLHLFLAPEPPSLNLLTTEGFEVGGSPRTIIPSDFDADGDSDVVVALETDNLGIIFVENDGAANFTIRRVEGAFDGVFGVIESDLNQDGLPDILATAEEVGPDDLPELVVFLSNP